MRYFSIIMILFIVSTGLTQTPPFNRGVNFTNWFQTSTPHQIQFTKFTKQDFINVQTLGCDVVRLPINLHHMTSGAPDYTLDPLFLHFLDQVVDWVEELEMHLIFDNHTFSPSESTDPNIDEVLVPVWTQMAEHFKNRSTYIYYEVLNEPHGISDKRWNEIQQKVVDAIREVDQKHTIIIGPAGWNSYNNLDKMPAYDDDNLIYTFHFYDPFIFTHQGASWTNPSMVPLSGVPFPYEADSMPNVPPELEGTWIASAMNGYPSDGTVDHVKELIDIAVEFKADRGVPLFCGEFGVYMPNSHKDDRVFWYDLVQDYFEEKNIAWTTWDYKGGFGLFEQGGNDLFEYDLNIPLIEALDLNAPEQKEFHITPDTTGFSIYDDVIGHQILESSWAADGAINYYSQDDPVKGTYCIHWTGSSQYGNIGFNFEPVRDLSWLVDEDYAIDFWVRCSSPGSSLDMRFVDTKTDDPDDHPWRMRITLDESRAIWDGTWQHLQIPLDEFTEHGSWDGGWYSPQGDFDWTRINEFEIVAEHHDLNGIDFYFDHIRLVDPQIVRVTDDPVRSQHFTLYPNIPNPFNPATIIRYSLPSPSEITLRIYNLHGQNVWSKTEAKNAGEHHLTWPGTDKYGKPAPSGVYFYQLSTTTESKTRQMLLLR